MAVYTASGRACSTQVINADTNGEIITFAFPVKSFILKVFGGTVYYKFATGDLDATGFRLDDGDALQLDLSVAFPIATSLSTLGTVFTASGTATVYVLAAF